MLFKFNFSKIIKIFKKNTNFVLLITSTQKPQKKQKEKLKFPLFLLFLREAYVSWKEKHYLST